MSPDPNLGQYFLANRQRVAAFSKHYYRDLDKAGEWPLISIPSWRPARPIEFAEGSFLDAFVPGAEFSPARPLPGLNAKYSQIRRTIAPGSRVPHNGDCYRIVSADFYQPPQKPIFTYGPCCYFDYHDTCEIHALKMAALERNEEDLIEFDLLDMAGRAGVPGVNAFTILLNFKGSGKRRGDYFILHRRSITTVQARNTLHVIPAGQHQPSQAHYGLDEDVSIWRTLAREFCEELFNLPEAHNLNVLAGDQLSTQKFRSIIDPIFRSGAARTHLLGFGLDPVTAKPEILVSNIIDFSKMSMPDADRLAKFDPNSEGEINYFELSREQLRTQIELYRGDDLKWLPAGKACLIEFERNYDLLLARR